MGDPTIPGRARRRLRRPVPERCFRYTPARMSAAETTCPGCGLQMPRGQATYDGSFHASPECWSVFTEVIGAEFGNAPLFGLVHQLTVDAYAVQHAGGPHPDKSVDVHLTGLHLVLERGLRPVDVPLRLQRLVAATHAWPHFDPPVARGKLTVADIALAGPAGHAETVRRWAAETWQRWNAHHAAVAEMACKTFGD